MNGYSLAYVALVVDNVDSVATIFTRDLGLRRVDCSVGDDRRVPVFGVGASAIALFEPGDPFLGGPVKPGVHHIALAAEDPEAAARSHDISVLDDGRREGLEGAWQVELDPAETSGVRTRFSEQLSIETSEPGPVQRIDHIGIASADNDSAIETFSRQFGCPVESRQTDLEVRTTIESFTSDKYGVVYHNGPSEVVGGLRVAFVTTGDCDLEFLQNFDPDNEGQTGNGRPGSTKQDQSAIARFIARRGPGLHHIALKTANIDGALASLHAAGHRVIDAAGRPGSRRALIGFIHPSALGGVLVHFVQREGP
mgnify:FL=1